PGAAPGAGPSGDLLAALSRHSASLQDITGQRTYGPPASARGPQSVPSEPPSPPVPPSQRAASGVYDPTGRHDRAPGDAGRPVPPSSLAPDGPTGPVPPTRASDSGRPLARRVRGAQMPTADPLSLRRATGEHTVPPGAPAARSGEAAEPPRQTRSADDVYSFLTSFTAGVQRGLDDARPPDGPGEDNGS
ncbi:MAG: hypothetical protein ACRD07_21225, partial [Acidimicrobiales bacterium]